MLFLVLMLALPLTTVISVFYVRYRFTRSRLTDFQVIDSLMLVRGLSRISLRKDTNYWRYWIRGRNLSNCARIYIIAAQEVSGAKREIHVAFDDWCVRPPRLQVLLEK